MSNPTVAGVCPRCGYHTDGFICTKCATPQTTERAAPVMQSIGRSALTRRRSQDGALIIDTPEQRERALLDAAEELERAKQALREAEDRYQFELNRWPTLATENIDA